MQAHTQTNTVSYSSISNKALLSLLLLLLQVLIHFFFLFLLNPLIWQLFTIVLLPFTHSLTINLRLFSKLFKSTLFLCVCLLLSLLILRFSFLFFLFSSDAASVRVVALHVPSSVRTGAEVELACLYELGNSSLYSLKWFYRANETDLDEQEFFRYTPSLLPHKQYFPIEGINVNVSRSWVL